MNKIYKVVWNKARNCYVVGSEFISSHSTGKTSVIGSKSINAVLAVAAVCSMLYLGSSNVFAAEPGTTEDGHYVAIATTNTAVGSTTKYVVNGNEYEYTLQAVPYTDSNNEEKTAYYYVRDGYAVKMEKDKRHDQAATSNVLRVYRNGATADDTGLLQSHQVMIKDDMNKEQKPIQTITGNTLQDVSTGTYVGTSNGGGTGTPIDTSYEYFIQDNGKWVDASDKTTTGAHFESAKLVENGTYEYNGQVVSIDNLYTVTKGGTPTVGVFVTSDGNLYTGKVFGRNNEVLMTTKNKDTTQNKDIIYSYWAAETMDPDSKINNMTIGQLNSMFNETNTNVKKVAGDAIDNVNVVPDGKNSGTISLMRRGTYNSATESYEKPVAVAGALKITSSGGMQGDDVAINILQDAGKGAYQQKFSLDAGSKVEARVDENNNKNLTGLSINGKEYQISQSSKTTVSNGTNTTVTSTVAEDGHTDYKVNLNKELEGIESISNGDAKINLNDTGVVISKGNDKTFSITNTGMSMSVIGDDYVERSIMVGKTGTVISGGLSVAGSKITNVAAGTDDTDAVNYGQLKKAVSEGNTDSHIKAGEYEVGADNKVSMDIVDKNGQSTGEKVTIKDVAKASDVGDVSKIDKDIQNKEGNTTVVNAVNNVNNKVGDLKYSQVAKDALVDGDNTTTAIGKLNQKLSDVEKTAGAHSTVSTDDSGNISVTPTKDEKTGATDYKVSLNKDLKLDSVKVGENVSLTKEGLTAGDTKVTNAGLSIGNKTYVSKDGLNANNQTITNVADGKVEKGSTDAVNGGQLYETNQAIANNATNISSLSHSISNLDNRVNKVGAGAAALAALHPLDFDPDAKWDFAAGYGNYRGANAAAVGAYYRPNEDTMFSVGGTFGNGENMVNAGVSFKLGSGSSHVSTSRVAMAKEIKELRGELEAMKSAMLDANAGKKIDTSKLQLFPDVPQNHWAYEYVAQLAGNGMIEGYPDGNFAGDRPMTRYEFAAILYRAMTKGAVLSDKILSEFSHELEYFTVDTIAKDKAGNPTIQRVRTVKENKNK